MLHHHASLHQIRQYLQQKLKDFYPVREAGSIARLILEHAGYPTSAVLLDPDRIPGPATTAQINEIVSGIHSGSPIQYLLGYTHFCELKIHVNPHVLIPRPETEELVYRVLGEYLDTTHRILDLGTGSGCIALALKKNLPGATVYGLDNSVEGLKIAAKNGLMNGLEVEWILADLLHGDIPRHLEGFDLMVSNPPYVLKSERAFISANVLEFEPAEALFVEDSDPLVYVERIAQLSMLRLNEGGAVWVEINERFGEESAGPFFRAGFKEVNILTDIHGKERFVRAKK